MRSIAALSGGPIEFAGFRKTGLIDSKLMFLINPFDETKVVSEEIFFILFFFYLCEKDRK